MSLSLEKVAQEAPALLSLAKHAQEAIAKRNFTGQTAKGALVLDFSGSMSGQYRNGSVQRLAEKALAFATQFDDDGAIDIFVFDSSAKYLGKLGLADYQGGIDRLTRGRRMGTTDYAGAFRAVADHYGYGNITAPAGEKRGLFGFGKKTVDTVSPLTAPASEPVYALFLTDGVPDNPAAAVKAITDVSYAPIFWQFLSIGRESIPFLEKLDDLDGRYIDNADYKPVGDVDRLSDEQLFELMLDEYPGWVAEERRRGQIR